MRIAHLVYNDASNDARVQKELTAHLGAGGEGKIFAVSRLGSGREPGEFTINGCDIVRLPEFQAGDILPAPLVKKIQAGVGTDWSGRQAQARSVEQAQPSPSPARPSLKGQAIGLGKKLAQGVAQRLYGPVRLGTWWMRVIGPLQQYRPDLIHANDANTLVPAMIASKILGVPYVYDSHELWTKRNVRVDRILAPYVEQLIEALGIIRAAGVITVSPSIASWLQERYKLGQMPSLVRNIPLPKKDGPGQLRQLAGLSENDTILSYSGGITTGRGLEEAVDCLATLPDDVHLVMLGYGDRAYIASLMERANLRGVDDRVHLVGPVGPSDVSSALSDADVALVAIEPTVLSYRFALPNKLFEALHGGIPVVCTDLPDMKEVVEAYGAGEVFAWGDANGLASAIAAVRQNRDSYADGAARAARELTWEGEARVLLDTYKAAVEGRS